MTTAAAVAPQTARRSTWVRPKFFLFTFIGVMFAYVLRHNESFLFNAKDPVWQHYQSFKWYLLPHGLTGACALLLGPLQFSDRLRQRYRKLHRVVGRFYIAGVLLGAPLGFYIQHFEERMGGTRSFSLAALTDASLWITTTAIALLFILRGNVSQHRNWMTRSYAVAIVFLEVRFVSGVLGYDDSASAGETIVWMCVAFSLLFADLVIHWQDLFRRAAPARVSAAAD